MRADASELRLVSSVPRIRNDYIERGSLSVFTQMAVQDLFRSVDVVLSTDCVSTLHFRNFRVK